MNCRIKAKDSRDCRSIDKYIPTGNAPQNLDGGRGRANWRPIGRLALLRGRNSYRWHMPSGTTWRNAHQNGEHRWERENRRGYRVGTEQVTTGASPNTSQVVLPYYTQKGYASRSSGDSSSGPSHLSDSKPDCDHRGGIQRGEDRRKDSK